MKKLLFLVFMLRSVCVFAHDDDKNKTTKEANTSVETKVLLNQANTQLMNFVSKNKSVALKPDLMQDLMAQVSNAAADDRGTAASLMGYLDSNQDKIKEELTWDNLVVLPVGLKKKIGDNATVTIGILKADFKPQYAELTIFIRLTTPINSDNSTEKQRDLFFGVEGLRFTKQAGLSASNFKAVLLGDYLLPFKDWTVYLKGGINKSESPSNDDPHRTYIQFDCGKFDKLNVAAKVIVPRSKLLPCTSAGEVIDSEVVRVTIDNLRFTTSKGLRDILFDSGTITPFALPNHREYAFFVSNLAFDMSDIGNPVSIGNTAAGFPVGYQGDTDEKWQGLYVGAFEIMLPEEFEEDGTSNRVKIFAEKIYWDRTGFSGLIGALSLNKKVNAKKWKLTLNSFELGFLQNQFKYGRFNGGVETPIHKSNAATSELFAYEAEIFLGQPLDGGVGKRSNYNLTVTTSRNMPLDFMFARGSIYAGSKVFLSLEYTTTTGYKFRPRAVLSGDMNIGVHTKESSQSTEFQDNKGVSFGKVTFRQMVLQTVQPYVSIEEFAYEQNNNNFLVNFPVQIKKFEKYTGFVEGEPQPPENLYTLIGVELDLLNGKIGGSTELIVISEYNANGKLRPKKVKVREITIKGELPTVCFDGKIGINETETVKEVYGNLTVAIKKPTPFEVGVAVLFARNKVENYKYGFVDVYATFEGGPGIPLGPVNLYGAGVAVYWNMSVERNACTECFAAAGTDGFLHYKINRDVKFGIKLMAAIRDPGPSAGSNSTFKARVYLDVAINQNWGIKHIGIYGNGVISGDFLDGDSQSSQKEYAKTFSSNTGGNESSSSNPADNAEKAKVINVQITGNTTPNVSTANTEPSAVISFTAGILFDFERKIFDLTAEAYLKATNLVGIGPNGRVGKVQLHFEQNNTFIHLGRSAKSERIGIKYQDNLIIDAYLMLGKGVEAFPMPDPEVMKFFPDLVGNARFTAPSPQAVGRTMFALGASAKVSIMGGGTRWYASGVVIAGLDIMIAKGACPDFPNNWGGKGQLYGLVKLDAGYKNKSNTRNIQLVSLGLGVYAYVQAPKPFGLDVQACLEVPNWLPGSSTKCISFVVGSPNGCIIPQN